VIIHSLVTLGIHQSTRCICVIQRYRHTQGFVPSQCLFVRLWVITTNDNINALRFYQRRGFRRESDQMKLWFRLFCTFKRLVARLRGSVGWGPMGYLFNRTYNVQNLFSAWWRHSCSNGNHYRCSDAALSPEQQETAERVSSWLIVTLSFSQN